MTVVSQSQFLRVYTSAGATLHRWQSYYTHTTQQHAGALWSYLPFDASGITAGQTGDEGLRMGAAKPAFRQSVSRADCPQPEPGQQHRMARNAQRSERIGKQCVGGIGNRSHQAAIGGCIARQRVPGFLDAAFQDGGCAVVERMSQRRGRMNPGQAMFGQRDGPKERGGHANRMNGRTYIVRKSRQRQRCRASAAAKRGLRFEHQNAAILPGQRDRGCQAVRTGADDDSVVSFFEKWKFRLQVSCSKFQVNLQTRLPESGRMVFCPMWVTNIAPIQIVESRYAKTSFAIADPGRPCV